MDIFEQEELRQIELAHRGQAPAPAGSEITFNADPSDDTTTLIRNPDYARLQPQPPRRRPDFAITGDAAGVRMSLPDQSPRDPAAYDARSAFITGDAGGVQGQRGGDPFDQEEARLALEGSIDATNEDGRPRDITAQVMRSLRVGDDRGAAEWDQQDGRIDAAGQAYVDAANQARGTTHYDPDGFGPAAGQRITYQEWSKLRREWQLNYPTDPLPLELQVFQLGLRSHGDDGQAVLDYALHNRDTEVLHDPAMQDEARRRFQERQPGRALPEVLQGTAEERQAAARAARLVGLREKFPAAAGMGDDELLAFDGAQQQRESDARLVREIRTTLGGRDPRYQGILQNVAAAVAGLDSPAGVDPAGVTDEQLLALAKASPQAFVAPVAEAAAPKLLEQARDREQKRRMGIAVEGDAAQVRAFDRALLGAEAAEDAGKLLAAVQIVPGVLNMGDLAAVIDSANLGLPAVWARLTGNGDEYRQAMGGYAEQHPLRAGVAHTAGFFTPGGPAGLLGKGLGKAVGMPLRNALADAAAQTTFRGAVRSALKQAPATAFHEAPWLARVGAGSLGAGLEMPFFEVATAAMQGDGGRALRSLNVADPETQIALATGMVLGPVLQEGGRGVGLAARRMYTEFSYRRAGGRDLDAELAQYGIEITDKAAVVRVKRFVAEVEAGKNVVDAAAASRVTPNDLIAAMRLAAAVRAARATKGAQGSAAGTDQTGRPPGNKPAGGSGPDKTGAQPARAGAIVPAPERPVGPPAAGGGAAPRPAAPTTPATRPPPPGGRGGGQEPAAAPAGPRPADLAPHLTPEAKAAVEGALKRPDLDADTRAELEQIRDAAAAAPAAAATITRGDADGGTPAPAETPAPAPKKQYPAELGGSEDVGRWYREEFADSPPGGAAIQALASMSEGKYVLADVPVDQVASPVVTAGDKDPGKIDAISRLDEAAAGDLPPAIFVGGRRGKLDVADGAHRHAAAVKRGSKTIRAYVPERVATERGFNRAGAPAAGKGEAAAAAEVTRATHEPAGGASAETILAKQRELVNLRAADRARGVKSADVDPRIDGLAAEIQNDLMQYEAGAGEGAAEALIERLASVAETPQSTGGGAQAPGDISSRHDASIPPPTAAGATPARGAAEFSGRGDDDLRQMTRDGSVPKDVKARAVDELVRRKREADAAAVVEDPRGGQWDHNRLNNAIQEKAGQLPDGVFDRALHKINEIVGWARAEHSMDPTAERTGQSFPREIEHARQHISFITGSLVRLANRHHAVVKGYARSDPASVKETAEHLEGLLALEPGRNAQDVGWGPAGKQTPQATKSPYGHAGLARPLGEDVEDLVVSKKDGARGNYRPQLLVQVARQGEQWAYRVYFEAGRSTGLHEAPGFNSAEAAAAAAYQHARNVIGAVLGDKTIDPVRRDAFEKALRAVDRAHPEGKKAPPPPAEPEATTPATSTTEQDERRMLAVFSDAAFQAAKLAPRDGWFGDNKVFISAAYAHLRKLARGGMPADVDLAEFKRRLVRANTAGFITLSRADLVAAMPMELVRESETRHLNAEFHFIYVDPGRADAWSPKNGGELVEQAGGDAGGGGGVTFTKEGPWDFQEKFPAIILNPDDPNEADALMRHGITSIDGQFVSEDGEAVEHGIHERIIEELGSYVASRQAAREMAATGLNPDGKPLTPKGVKGALGHANDMQHQLNGVLDSYTDVFGERAADALRAHVEAEYGNTATPDLSAQDENLLGALHAFANAEERWEKLAAAGADDATLKAAIGREFGIDGGATGRDGGWRAKGGNNPRFWLGIGTSAGKPTLQGKPLLLAVRRLLRIGPPPGAADAGGKTNPPTSTTTATRPGSDPLGKFDGADAELLKAFHEHVREFVKARDLADRGVSPATGKPMTEGQQGAARSQKQAARDWVEDRLAAFEEQHGHERRRDLERHIGWTFDGSSAILNPREGGGDVEVTRATHEQPADGVQASAEPPAAAAAEATPPTPADTLPPVRYGDSLVYTDPAGVEHHATGRGDGDEPGRVWIKYTPEAAGGVPIGKVTQVPRQSVRHRDGFSPTHRDAIGRPVQVVRDTTRGKVVVRYEDGREQDVEPGDISRIKTREEAPAGVELFKGVPTDKPVRDLTDDEFARIIQPDPNGMERRNAELAKHQDDPRFLRHLRPGEIGYQPSRPEGAAQPVMTDWNDVRRFILTGELTELGKRVDAAASMLREISKGDPRGAVPEGASLATAWRVLRAIDLGQYNQALHPDNRHARELFRRMTGVKLPRGVAATQKVFTGTPFPTGEAAGKIKGDDAQPPAQGSGPTPQRQPVVAGPPELPQGTAGTVPPVDAGEGQAATGVDRGAPADPAPAVDGRPRDPGPGAPDVQGGVQGGRGGAGDGGADRPARRAGAHAGADPVAPARRDAGGVGGGAAEPAGERPAPARDPSSLNHRIGEADQLAPLGDAGKTDANLRAIKLLKQLEKEGRNATPGEKQVLAQYVGWGGLPGALDTTKALKRESATRGWLQGAELDNHKNWEKKWGKRYDALKELLTEDEWNAAARSTINAHYTSRPIIERMWELARWLGFKGGHVLEAGAGVGHFLGLQPADLAGRSHWTAVERDSISGRILAKLYPEALVMNEGFEHSKILPNTQDLVIGNVPFDADGPVDKRYPKLSLHNYFIARSLDLVRPGGFVLQISSTSTLDGGASLRFREHAATLADLVWAVRLPNTAFKANAGTEVTTDIILLRKRDGGAFPHAQPWRSALAMPTHDAKGDVDVNEYFHRHPEQLLGLLSLEGSMRGANEPALLPHPDRDLGELLAAAIRRAPQLIAGESSAALVERARPQAADPLAKEGSYQLTEGGEVRQVRGRLLTTPEWASAKTAATWARRAKEFIALREQAKALLELQRDPDAAAGDVEKARARLNKLYDAYVGKHGAIAARGSQFLADDPEYPIVQALEFVEPEAQTVKKKGGGEEVKFVNVVRKADVFTKRTIHPRTPPAKAESVADALAISRSWRGSIDLEYVGQLLGLDPAAAAAEAVAKDLAYVDPETGRVVAPDEYLAGNVRVKLARARAAAEQDPAYTRNVTALEAVQPAPLKMGQISVRVGSTWIPPRVIESWADALFGMANAARVVYTPQVGKWHVAWSYQVQHSAGNKNTHAAGGVPATELIEDSLNLKSTIAYDPPAKSGDRPTKNAERTIAAQAGQDKLQQHFKKWITGSEHVPELERIYNETFNSVRLRTWPQPTFAHYPGASDVITLRPHQRAAVSRGTVESYLLAHAVGTGKTFTFITTAMEWRRLGLARKPMIVAQNATVEQIVASFKRLYPGANVLAPTQADFDRANRRRLMSRIATGDYDAVVVAHSQFEMLSDDAGRVAAYTRERLDELEEALRTRRQDVGESGGKGEWSRDPTVKELQKAIQKLEARLEGLADRKVDDMLTFEQLGVDGLIVDEAHRYKKLEFTSQMDNIKGLDRAYSKRGFGLFMKVRYIQERNAGRGVILATGTPITNTLAEAWNMMRYVRPDLLRAYGIESFDAFATLFTQPVTQLEMTAAGWKMETRLASYTNLPELVNAWRTAADVINPEEVDLPRPGLKGGKPQTVNVQPTGPVKAYLQYLIDRYRAWTKLSGKEKREQSHVPLVINGLARSAALDLRLVDPNAKDDPGSKLNRSIAEMLRIYRESTPWLGTQVVFAERYHNKQAAAPTAAEQAADVEGGDGDDGGGAADAPAVELGEGYHLWRDVRAKLIAGGVPAEEIAIIYEHDTKKKRPVLFEAVNQGKVRFVLGSTDKLGVGVNVQRLLTALHHLDAPHRPADIEQREGRILRQGNMLLDLGKQVEILRYGTENSLDAGQWGRLALKQRFINQVMRGEVPGRTAEDGGNESVISFDEAAALISGNPLVMERIGNESRLRQLQALKFQFDQGQVEARQKLRQMRAEVPRAERDVAQLKDLEQRLVSQLEADPPALVAGGKEFKGKEAVNGELDRIVREALAFVRKRAGDTYSTTPVTHQLPDVEINGVTFHLKASQRMDVQTGKAAAAEPEVEWQIAVPGQNAMMGQGTTGAGILRSARQVVPNRLSNWRISGEAFLRRAAREVPELEQYAEGTWPEQAEYEQRTKRAEEIEATLAAEAKPPADQGGAEDPATPAAADVLDEQLLEQAFPDPEARAAEVRRRRSRQGGFLNLPFLSSPPSPASPSPHAFADPAVETRFTEAQAGITSPPWRERLRQATEGLWARWTRPFEFLPLGAQYAEAKRVLLWLQKQRSVRQHDGVRALDQVLSGLDAGGKSYDLFTRRVILEDLAEEVEQQGLRNLPREEAKLPFGFTADLVDAELAKVRKKNDPKVAAALSRRAMLWDSVKADYSRAMKAIGFDAGKKLTRRSYYRHQVLMYAQARAVAGTGNQLRTPTGRSFLKFRAGSEHDINANYLQAEFEVLAQMMYDTQIAKAIAELGEFYDVTKQLKKEAAKRNYQQMLAGLQILADLQGKTPEQVYRRLYNWKQAKGFGELFYAASVGDLPDDAAGSWADLLQAMADVHDLRDTGVQPDAALTPAMHAKLWRYAKFVSSLPPAAGPKAEAAKLAFGMIFKGRAEKRQHTKELLGRDYVEWQDLVPEGYEVWQPRPGSQMYLADTIPARVAQDLLGGVLASAEISAKDIKKVLAKASPFPGLTIPSELAATLEKLFEPASDEFLAEASQKLLNGWKKYVLMNPRRALKFNLRNLSGDADAVFAFNPHAFKHLPQAAREVDAVLRRGAQMTPTMRTWFERGGMQTMLTVQELGDIDGLEIFKRFDQRTGLTPLAKKAWQAWWRRAEAVSNYREAILRYANFLSYREQIKAGRGRPANFGASLPQEVMALRDHDDRAFILSNEVAGAYDSISTAGRTVRRHWFPFWSFVESNFRRYWRGMKNAARDGETAHTVGRLLLRKAASPYTYVRVGRFFLKAAALWTAMTVYNWLFFREEEESLPPEVRARPHLIFGRDANGKVRYFDRLGAMQDVLDWFGADEVPEHVRQWLNGRRSPAEILGQIAQAPAKKFINGFNPFWKLPAELLSGRQLFPDPFDPRAIRDRGDYLARSFNVEHEFRALTDRPSPAYWRSWGDLAIYRSDPDGAAYYELLDKKAQYLKRVGKGGGGDFNSPRTEALRNYKLAVRYQDKQAAAKYLAEYAQLGGTRRGFRQSLEAMDPLAGMSRPEARGFVSWLTPEERSRIAQARRYYVRVLLGRPADADPPQPSTN